MPAVVNLNPDAAFDPETETIEAVGPYSYIQKKSGNRYTQDSVLLVDFVLETASKGLKAIDLGAGAGIMPVLIAAKTAAMEITGVEVVAECAALAQRNALRNGLSSRIRIVSCDYRDLPANYPEGAFDIVISNPPYIKAGAGRQSTDMARRIGRSEVMGGLKDLLAVSSHLIGKNGRMFFVFPALRMREMLGEMEALKIIPLRILRPQGAEPSTTFHHREFLLNTTVGSGKWCWAANGKNANVFLIEAGRA